jgi:hypothetical protein
MRNYDSSRLDVTSRRYFGGGGGGGGGNSAAAAQQHEAMMAQMRAQQAASERQAAEMARQSREQQKQMEKQLGIMEQSRLDALESQRAQLEQIKAGQVKPDPVARVMDDTSTDQSQRRAAASRRGLRKSILAGESSQAPLTTGPDTLGYN